MHNFQSTDSILKILTVLSLRLLEWINLQRRFVSDIYRFLCASVSYLGKLCDTLIKASIAAFGAGIDACVLELRYEHPNKETRQAPKWAHKTSSNFRSFTWARAACSSSVRTWSKCFEFSHWDKAMRSSSLAACSASRASVASVRRAAIAILQVYNHVCLVCETWWCGARAWQHVYVLYVCMHSCMMAMQSSFLAACLALCVKAAMMQSAVIEILLVCCMCGCMYVCVYVCVYTQYVCVYVCVYTHTCTIPVKCGSSLLTQHLVVYMHAWMYACVHMSYPHQIAQATHIWVASRTHTHTHTHTNTAAIPELIISLQQVLRLDSKSRFTLLAFRKITLQSERQGHLCM
jgi:hypothetical protein